MKITKSQLKQIIKEEIKSTQLLNEAGQDTVQTLSNFAKEVFNINPKGFVQLYFDENGYYTEEAEDVFKFDDELKQLVEDRTEKLSPKQTKMFPQEEIDILFDFYDKFEDLMRETGVMLSMETAIEQAIGAYSEQIDQFNEFFTNWPGEGPLPEYIDYTGYFFNQLYELAKEKEEAINDEIGQELEDSTQEFIQALENLVLKVPEEREYFTKVATALIKGDIDQNDDGVNNRILKIVMYALLDGKIEWAAANSIEKVLNRFFGIPHFSLGETEDEWKEIAGYYKSLKLDRMRPQGRTRYRSAAPPSRGNPGQPPGEIYEMIKQELAKLLKERTK
jgi:hypothetical protein